MKNLKTTVSILVLSVTLLGFTSCKDKKTEEAAKPMSSEMHHEDGHSQTSSDKMMSEASGNTASIIENYLKIKNALVASNEDEAATAGGMLESNFKEFDKSPYSSEEQKELTDIITDAIEHAEHISESPLEHQREHFDLLSKDLIDMIAITGTDKKLYQDYCPMYNNNKGAAWLSTTKEIKNPYFGSKMMNCGKIQKEIN
ncbi:DUF3347 domain-containing protein [Marixanthomonas spongiae]|uniref:DUF3347 domain-containing protein n=1 Tax=Marixanthomonas spongiae TaxID=2174845 RepID=A0A2U0HX94_9FLAO|nr:DUF3347 domain-containing protein [Marixanthomonas spongiae]PVW13484.1 hypothetical protein DDV96_12550 [Marixanthomonas spongiae]